MQYLDFELEVLAGDAGDAGDYTVRVLRSPAGEASGTMRLPFTGLALQNNLQALQIALLRSGTKRRRIETAESQTVQAFGRELWKALFSGDILGRFEATRGEARRQEAGVRIKLRFESPELAALPWEYLFDADRGDYVTLSASTPLIRYIPLPEPMAPLLVTPPLRVLGMIVSPSDLAALDVDHERKRLDTALADLVRRGLVELTWMAGGTWRDLQQILWKGPWHAFHFIGHGGFDEVRGEGLVVFLDEFGRSQRVSATDLGRLLGDHDPLRLAVLNACESARGDQFDVFSSTAATLVRRGTPAVVAMQYEITDDAAIEFSRSFYEAVGIGIAVDTALAEARKGVALAIPGTLEWGTPVLYMRAPDGVLFDIPAVPVEPSPPPEPPGPMPQPAAPEPGPASGGPPPRAPEPPPGPATPASPPPAGPDSPAAQPATTRSLVSAWADRRGYATVGVLAVVGTTLVLLLAFVAWAAIGGDRATPSGSGPAGASPGSGVVEPTPSEPAATPTETVETVEPVPSEPGATPAGTIVLSAGGDLWVAAPDGTQPALLVGEPGTQTDASWSPDGSQVVYRDPDVGLLIVTRDGSPVAAFTDDGRDTNPAWAPDGGSIAFAGRRSSSGLDIYTGTLAAPTEVRRLTTARADDWDPTWSPDGDRIAFATKRDGNAAIYTMEANGRILGRLTTDGAIYDDPAWSPDGDWIAVTRRETSGDPKVLWVMRSDGRDARRLTDSGVDEHDPTWSPDGRFLAFVRADAARQIVIIDVNLAREVATVGVPGARTSTPDWR